ncbi:hypothetical protein EYF80_066880 [Liparis tanakae]|uniref:Uncharacterized protein n=1 Tax=Liparis tanakae TaxID=230148 RepID=A0A4Z2E2W4_9TELE|nr:hypothetical protein EYF80_066880 [Liparis tanakae]
MALLHRSYLVTGQTYSRKVDVDCLSSLASSLHFDKQPEETVETEESDEGKRKALSGGEEGEEKQENSVKMKMLGLCSVLDSNAIFRRQGNRQCPVRRFNCQKTDWWQNKE